MTRTLIELSAVKAHAVARRFRSNPTVALKPLSRFITPIGFGDKVLNKSKHCLGFSLKSFQKRLAASFSPERL